MTYLLTYLKLLEIIKADRTLPDAQQTASKLCHTCNKTVNRN